MKVGILEVLVVNAEGLGKTHLVGTPSYHVIIQSGTQTHQTKASSDEDDVVFWNEKFVFEFPMSEWKNLSHIKFRIMDKEMFSDGGFVGETIINLEGILTEAIDRGCIELLPSLYNVVLEDESYEGQIKIGLKFIANVEMQTESREYEEEENKEPRWSIYRTIFNFWRIPWWGFFFSKQTKIRAIDNK